MNAVYSLPGSSIGLEIKSNINYKYISKTVPIFNQ